MSREVEESPSLEVLMKQLAMAFSAWLIAMVVFGQRWNSSIFVFSSLHDSVILRSQYQSKEMRGTAQNLLQEKQQVKMRKHQATIRENNGGCRDLDFDLKVKTEIVKAVILS